MRALKRFRNLATRIVASSALALAGLGVAVTSPSPAWATHTFTQANANTALDAFVNTYYNSGNGLFYSSQSNHAPLDLWTTAYIRRGLCQANANNGGKYRQLLSDTYYGFENSERNTFTWTETVNGVQRTTTDTYWWNGGNDANDDWLWNIDAAICAYQATGDTHMLNEAEAEARHILETQLDNRAGFGDYGIWHDPKSIGDYKDISTTGQMPYIAEELAQYFPTETIYNNALGQSYTYSQYATMTYQWVRSWIQADGSILNGTNGSLTGYFDNNHYMMNVGLIDDDVAALYRATGDASYLSDAIRITDWARNRFTIPYNGKQILWPQWTTSDNGAHYDQWVDSDNGQNTVAKGIMSRGIVDFMQATGTGDYMQWMEDNAQTAWDNRHLADNLLYTNWQVPNTLPAGSLASGDFTGVDLMQRVIQAQSNPFLLNAGFETDGTGTSSPLGWSSYDFGNSANDGASYTENKASPWNAHSGNYMLTQYKNTAYQTYTSQTVTNIPNGTYTLTVWVRSSGGQTSAYMDAKNYGGSDLHADMSGATSGSWTQITIPNVQVSNHQATVGFYSNAPAGKWVNIDDVQLTPPAVSDPAYTGRNLSFEDDNAATANPADWSKYDFGNSANDAASYTESKAAPYNARTGSYMLTHWGNSAYQVYTFQTIKGLTNGTYNLTAWVRSSGGQTASYMDMKDYGGSTDLQADMSHASGSAWTLVSIDNVAVTNGQATIGFYSNAAAGQWVNIDDVNLARH